MKDGELSEGIASVSRLDSEFNMLAEAPLGADMAYRFHLSDLTGKDRVRLGHATPEESRELYHTRLGHKNKRDLGEVLWSVSRCRQLSTGKAAYATHV